MLIKFGYITVILFKNCCFIQSHLDTNSNKFISFIQESKDIQLNINSDNFSLTIFENILLYLSENIDTFLEESIIYFNKLSIDNFKKKQLGDILKFQT